MIHPTAIVHPHATLDPTVRVGPYAVIDEDVSIGPHCVIGPHVYITGQTRLGSYNQLYAGCVLGEAPQDLKYRGEPTRLHIGDHNVFREYVTVHRSSHPEGLTKIGSHNFLMANSHVGHNCHLADHIILANGALLGGHVTVDDRAFISGTCLVHQFVHIGTLVLTQGGSGFGKDIPPYTIGVEINKLCGLNIIGLRRAGITASDRLELKQLYRELFRSGRDFRTALAEAQKHYHSAPARVMLDFIATSKRGVCFDATRLRPADLQEEE